ncbi:MAG: hypothetical protein ACTSX1_09660 [Candidatus Heimdallarchaeaceae archaeon]
MSLFLMVLFITSPVFSVAEERDFSKYSTTYNEITTEKLAAEIFEYVKNIKDDQRVVNFRNNRDIILDIFAIVDRYNCSKELYVINRGIDIRPAEGKMQTIFFQLFVMNAIGLIDETIAIFDIDAVKKGIPVEKRTNIQRS